jgi:hypothetical protein
MYNFQNIEVVENQKVNLMPFQNDTNSALEIWCNHLPFTWYLTRKVGESGMQISRDIRA